MDKAEILDKAELMLNSDDIRWLYGASGLYCIGQINYHDVLEKAIIVSPVLPKVGFAMIFPFLTKESETNKMLWIADVIATFNSAIMVKSSKTGATGVFLRTFTPDRKFRGTLFTMVGPIYTPTDHTEIRVELEIRAT